MSSHELKNLILRMECALADMPLHVREVVEEGLNEIANICLLRIAKCDRLRQIQASDSHARLFARMQEVSQC